MAYENEMGELFLAEWLFDMGIFWPLSPQFTRTRVALGLHGAHRFCSKLNISKKNRQLTDSKNAKKVCFWNGSKSHRTVK